MKKYVGKITLVVLLLIMIAGLTTNLVAPSALAVPVGFVLDQIGAFTGPRTGYNTDDNVKSSIDSVREIVLSGAPRYAQGEVYYVDAYAAADGDGLSWAGAFDTVTEAITASNTNLAISGNTYKRNTIYIAYGFYIENFTTMPRYADVVGVGGVSPFIYGDWVITAEGNNGPHFYNIDFGNSDAGGTIFTLTGMADLEFHECRIIYQATDAYGLVLSNCDKFLIDNCLIGSVATSPGDYGFGTAAIKIVDAAGTQFNSFITNNVITSRGIGIDWDETETSNCWVIGNYIKSTGRAIDDESNYLRVVNNRMITLANTTSDLTTGYHFDLKDSAGNLLTGSGVTDTVPFLLKSD